MTMKRLVGFSQNCCPGTTSSGGGLGELGLRSGDTIVLGAGVQCGANCSQPMLDMAKGFLGFQGVTVGGSHRRMTEVSSTIF